MSVGQRVKSIRKKLGLSQKDFASKLSLNQGTLSHIELDDPKYPIGKKTAAGLKSVFKVNMDYLMNGTGDPFLKGLKAEDLVNDPPVVYGESIESLKERLREKDDYNSVLKKLADITEKLRVCESERVELQRKLDELTFGADDRKKINA